jgi:hypothetical protein
VDDESTVDVLVRNTAGTGVSTMNTNSGTTQSCGWRGVTGYTTPPDTDVTTPGATGTTTPGNTGSATPAIKNNTATDASAAHENRMPFITCHIWIRDT